MKFGLFLIFSAVLLLGITAVLAQQPGGTESLDEQLTDAAYKGDVDAVQSLLQRGASVNAVRATGMTALMEAAYRGDTRVAKLLMDKDANIEAKDHDGHTALAWGVQFGTADVVKLLLDRGASIETKGYLWNDTILIVAATFNKTEIVKLLLDRGANIEAKNDQGQTALMVAGKAEVIKLLLDRGANIEATDHLGMTALILAAYWGKAEAAKQLLDRGANIDAKELFGKTAHDVAVEDNHQEIALLIDQANPREELGYILQQFKNNPNDSALRNHVIDLVTLVHPAPAIPDEARQHFAKGVALMQIKSTPSRDDIKNAEQEFIQADQLAPWWGDAYYNLSRVQESLGEFDFALDNLSWYIKTKPSDADAQDAQARIYTIQAEKHSAEQATEQHQRELAFRYVSGGIQRLRDADLPANMRGNGVMTMGPDNYFGYTLPDEDPYYLNIFRMPNGRFISVTLQPISDDPVTDGCARNPGGICRYKGDEILVADLGAEPCGTIWPFAFGTLNAPFLFGACPFRYQVSISTQPNAVVSISFNQATITLPVDLLYRGRAVTTLRKGIDSGIGKGFHETYGCIGPPNACTTRHITEIFNNGILRSANDPNVNPLNLTPDSFFVESH